MEKIKDTFANQRRSREDRLRTIDRDKNNLQPIINDWQSRRKHLKKSTVPAFANYANTLREIPNPPPMGPYKKVWRRFLTFQGGTWSHWRGVLFRTQLAGLYLFRFIWITALIALILYLTFQLFNVIIGLATSGL